VAANEAAGSRPSAPARQIPALLSLVDAANRIVWPADAPAEGDLGPKRQVADQATSRVAAEVRAQGTAAMTSVAEARKELVDYGQPALQQLRTTTTPAVSESFHSFLLTLYQSLAQAAQGGAPPIDGR
jgi:hypothetical protein